MTNKILLENKWPNNINLEELRLRELDYNPAKAMQKSIFSFLKLPSLILLSFITIITSGNAQSAKPNKAPGRTETYFFKIFDEIYSLSEMEGRESVIESFMHKLR